MKHWSAIAGACGIVLFVALVKLPDPIMDDQAIFVLGAKALAAGDALYRDYWDLKPPGIFLWYWLGGSLFGYTEIGLHVFDSLWMVATAALLVAAVAPACGMPRAAWSGVVLVGMYLLALEEWYWGQVEAAVLLPLTLVLLGLVRLQGSSRPSIWSCAVGLGAGIAFVYKPYLCLIPAALVLTWLVWGRGVEHRRHLILISGSAALPVLALALWFVAKGAWYESFESLVLVPRELAAATNVSARVPVLLWSIRDFLNHLFPFVGLGAVGLLAGVLDLARKGLSPERRLLVNLVLAWAVSTLAAILVQVLSWWSHHFLLLLPAVAVLVVYGASWVWRQGRLARCAYLGLFLACCFPATHLRRTVARVVLRPGDSLAALAPAERLSFQRRLSEHYNIVYQESLLPESNGRPGPIYVWGSNLIYLFTRREAASKIQGFLSEVQTDPIRDRLYRQLLARPPVYVYLAHDWRRDKFVISDRRFGPWLRSQYRPVRETLHGVWYERITSN